MRRVVLLLGLTAMMWYTCQTSSNLYPVILVPGSGGNQLEARLTSHYKPSSVFCKPWYPIRKDKEGWFRLWFDLSVLVPAFTRCFAERMRLYYDPVTDDYYNAPGVETRVPYFGSTQSLLYLDPSLKQTTSYMASLVESLEKLGYSDGKNLFGAPYDFRYGLAPEGHPSRVGSQFLQDLKHLIEGASNSNRQKPVILLSHSLGCLYVLQLLNRSPKSWAQRYIRHFIALSGPWAGTVEELLTFASGNSLGVPIVDRLLVRDEQRSSETNLWLMPSPKVFGSKGPLVVTQNSTYSAYEINTFLEDIGFPQGVHPYKTRVLPLVESLTVPDLAMTCVIGSGVMTPERLVYGGGFDVQPEIEHGDGDGTVNMVSLLALESEWRKNRTQSPFKVVKLEGVSHSDILKERSALDHIMREINCINFQVPSSVL
ncbi:Lecithin:cholesterol/phospholipid:diacylglycerol acyltransferase [Dillenia turbinata]|uniref:Lecithin:cholesterol/phospholipid:diacylglycerol acyltransferase n=1 Tax=Dillenia turbinata TaxID=194707 RepID=A0AAN8W5V7_9MAGN